MATVQCRACGQADSIAFCAETGEPLCADCAVTCQVCRVPINKKRVQLTSTGRKLCSKCMADRNARRKAKKEELRRAEKRETNAPAAVASTSFQALNDSPPPKPSGTSFQDLMAGDDAPLMRPVEFDEEEETAEPRGEVHGLLSPEDEEGRTWGPEGAPQEGSNRLQLPPIDDHRPILTSSGYQGPSRTAWVAAFALFGIGAAIFWSVFPGIREIMLPWDTTALNFSSNLSPTATDTNALRNMSNVNQFELLSQGPIFFVAWAIVGVYVLGFTLIIWSLVRSIVSSHFAKRRLKKAEEYARKYGHTYPQ